MRYLFKTTATTKRNSCYDWCDSKYIPNVVIEASNVHRAFDIYVNDLKEQNIVISRNARRRKCRMYEGDHKQVGWVVTARTAFYNIDDDYHWKEMYIDLWVEVLTIIDTKF